MNPRVVEKGQYYQILQGENGGYFWYIYDALQEVVFQRGSTSKCATITMITDTVVRCSLSYGTGVGATETLYYHTKKDCFSKLYYGVYNEYGERIVYADDKKLVVRDIFDKNIYYYEYTELHDDLYIAPPSSFIEISFVENGTKLKAVHINAEQQKLTTMVDLP